MFDRIEVNVIDVIRQIATKGAIWSNSNQTKGGTLMQVRDAATVRNASVSCNVKFVSGTRTSQIESAYARSIPRSNS
jgi:hypothetical protein